MTDRHIPPLQVGRAIAYVELRGARVPVLPTTEFVRAFNALLARTGGATTNAIEAATSVAQQALSAAGAAPIAAVAAYDAGAPSGYTLSPASPIATEIVSLGMARANIAAHTRTPAGLGAISLNGGSVSIARGVAYIIYYNDPTDAGGAVTYLATDDATVAGDYASGARIVGTAFVAEAGDVFGAGAPV